MTKPPPFINEERLVERDALDFGIDLYESKRGKLYRCRFCHVGFSPAEHPNAQRRALEHLRTQHRGGA
jgi:hypothetical protein